MRSLSRSFTSDSAPACLAQPAAAPRDLTGTGEKRSAMRIAVHPLLRDLLLTGATELSVLVAGLLLVSLYGRLLGAVALGEFLLLRRATSWLGDGALLCMGNAIPRYVALSADKANADRSAYFLTGSGFLLLCTVCTELVFYFGRKWLAAWMFGSAQLSYLILPLGLLFAGLAAQAAVYGYYRGVLEMRPANAIQLLHFAIIPVGAVALLYRTRSVALILDVTGAVTILAATLFACPVVRSFGAIRGKQLKLYGKELLRYGVGRVPGTFGTGALLALGPLVATHYVSMTQVGYLLLGVSFLTVIGYTTGPVGVLLLSKLSAMVGQNRIGEARPSLTHLIGAILDISVFTAVQAAILADVLIRAWVGPRFLAALTVTRILIFAVPPYLLFMVARSCVDAATPKALNTRNVLISLGVFGALLLMSVQVAPLGYLIEAFASSLVIALVFLGLLTAWTFWQLYGVGIQLRTCARSLCLGILLGAVTYGLRQFIAVRGAIPLAALLELGIIAIFLAVHRKLRSPWLRLLWQMAFSESRPAASLTAEQLL